MNTSTNVAEKQYISTKEAAELAGTSMAKARQWCNDNAEFGYAKKESNRWQMLKSAWLLANGIIEDETSETPTEEVEVVAMSKPAARGKIVINTENVREVIQPPHWSVDANQYRTITEAQNIAAARGIYVSRSRIMRWCQADDNGIWACRAIGVWLVNLERFCEFFKVDIEWHCEDEMTEFEYRELDWETLEFTQEEWQACWPLVGEWAEDYCSDDARGLPITDYALVLAHEVVPDLEYQPVLREFDDYSEILDRSPLEKVAIDWDSVHPERHLAAERDAHILEMA